MTREEQIREASATALLEINCDIHRAVISAFQDGARWADSNPINVWHDASEEPEKWKNILVEVLNTIPKNNKVIYFDEYVEGWLVGLMKTDGFKCRWAYVSDLLPKGCEWGICVRLINYIGGMQR